CQVLSLTSQIETTTLVSHQMKVVSTQKCEYPKDYFLVNPVRTYLKFLIYYNKFPPWLVE
ncbi:hypothetical protein LIZ76_07600, partial [Caldibacillus sp. 210928-DFI.2.22]|uniref:hypothetical protein n=1 Tax=unclassified Caldibacillus TaxID=2641266 RepID=UPI001D0975FB